MPANFAPPAFDVAVDFWVCCVCVGPLLMRIVLPK